MVRKIDDLKHTTFDEINNYTYRMEIFEQNVATVLAKFKRLHGDWLVCKADLDKKIEKQLLMSDAILLEQKAQS